LPSANNNYQPIIQPSNSTSSTKFSEAHSMSKHT